MYVVSFMVPISCCPKKQQDMSKKDYEKEYFFPFFLLFVCDELHLPFLGSLFATQLEDMQEKKKKKVYSLHTLDKKSCGFDFDWTTSKSA